MKNKIKLLYKKLKNDNRTSFESCIPNIFIEINSEDCKACPFSISSKNRDCFLEDKRCELIDNDKANRFLKDRTLKILVERFPNLLMEKEL